MTDAISLKQVEQLLAALPGISSVSLVRSESSDAIVGSIRCSALSGFDAIARCGSGANVAVTLGQSESSNFRILGSVSGLNCLVKFYDDKNERPTQCQTFGFYAAVLLYNDGLIDDDVLDELEPLWNVNFGRNAE